MLQEIILFHLFWAHIISTSIFTLIFLPNSSLFLTWLQCLQLVSVLLGIIPNATAASSWALHCHVQPRSQSLASCLAGCHQNEPPLGSPCLHFKLLTNKQTNKQIPWGHPRVGKKSSGAGGCFPKISKKTGNCSSCWSLQRICVNVWCMHSSTETEALCKYF